MRRAALAVLLPILFLSTKFSVNVEFYERVEKFLREGDVVYCFCARRRTKEGKFVFPERKLNECLSGMRKVKKGVEKGVTFSSLEDLKKYVSELPKDVAWVFYNTERGMTPVNELRNLAASVKEFAEIAHKHGKKVGWGPPIFVFTKGEKWKDAVKYVDRVGVQMQKGVKNLGIEKASKLLERLVEEVRKANPKCETSTQIVLEMAGEEAEKCCKMWVSEVDVISLWTVSGERLADVMKRLRKEKQVFSEDEE